MTEQVPFHGPEQLAGEPAAEHVHADEVTRVEPVRTGVPAVDDVLSEIDQLDDVPLGHHLAAFERAHGVLRSALDAEPGDPA